MIFQLSSGNGAGIELRGAESVDTQVVLTTWEE